MILRPSKQAGTNMDASTPKTSGTLKVPKVPRIEEGTRKRKRTKEEHKELTGLGSVALSLIGSDPVLQVPNCWLNKGRGQVEITRGLDVELAIPLGHFSPTGVSSVTLSLKRRGNLVGIPIVGCQLKTGTKTERKPTFLVTRLNPETTLKEVEVGTGHEGYTVQGHEKSIWIRMTCGSGCSATTGPPGGKYWQLCGWTKNINTVTHSISIPLQVFSPTWAARRRSRAEDPVTKRPRKASTATSQMLERPKTRRPAKANPNVPTNQGMQYNTPPPTLTTYQYPSYSANLPFLRPVDGTFPSQSSGYQYPAYNPPQKEWSGLVSNLNSAAAPFIPSTTIPYDYNYTGVTSKVTGGCQTYGYPNNSPTSSDEEAHVTQYRIWYRNLKPEVQAHQREIVRRMSTSQ